MKIWLLLLALLLIYLGATGKYKTIVADLKGGTV